MAKKKTTASSTPEETTKPAKKSAPKIGSKSKAPKPVAAPEAPMVDTQLAAQNAARMLSAKAAGYTPTQAGGDRKETSAFKQLKQSMTNPHATGMGGLLDSTASAASRKSAVPFRGGKQVGHNQTFGADVSRNSVPRRTGG